MIVHEIIYLYSICVYSQTGHAPPRSTYITSVIMNNARIFRLFHLFFTTLILEFGPRKYFIKLKMFNFGRGYERTLRYEKYVSTL